MKGFVCVKLDEKVMDIIKAEMSEAMELKNEYSSKVVLRTEGFLLKKEIYKWKFKTGVLSRVKANRFVRIGESSPFYDKLRVFLNAEDFSLAKKLLDLYELDENVNLGDELCDFYNDFNREYIEDK